MFNPLAFARKLNWTTPRKNKINCDFNLSMFGLSGTHLYQWSKTNIPTEKPKSGCNRSVVFGPDCCISSIDFLSVREAKILLLRQQLGGATVPGRWIAKGRFRRVLSGVSLRCGDTLCLNLEYCSTCFGFGTLDTVKPRRYHRPQKETKALKQRRGRRTIGNTFGLGREHLDNDHSTTTMTTAA